MRVLGVGLGLDATTVALGAATVMFGPALLAMAESAAKSLIKSGIKGSLLLYDRSRQMVSEDKESIEDLAAEAKAEIAKPPKQKQIKKDDC